jgi:hypothetical protein
MLKRFLIAVCAILASTMLTASAFPWGSGTHLYIAEQLNDYRLDCLDRESMYGAMAPDLNSFAPEDVQADIRRETHHSKDYGAIYGFEAVEKKAFWLSQRAFAAGFVTHNEEWGADYYAHLDPGYVRDEKNAALVEVIRNLWPPGQCPLTDEQLVSAAETCIEASVDLLLKEEHDEDLGRKITKAASRRSWTIPLLLGRAYFGFVGKGLLAAEAAFRLYAIEYGEIIALPQPEDKEGMAAGIALLAKERYGIEVTSDQCLSLLEMAMTLCIADDYFGAIQDNIAQMNPAGAPARPRLGASRATLWGEIKGAR